MDVEVLQAEKHCFLLQYVDAVSRLDSGIEAQQVH